MTLVYGMLVLETMQTALVSHDVFVAFASQFGDSAAIDSIRNHWFSIPVCGGICKSYHYICGRHLIH